MKFKHGVFAGFIGGFLFVCAAISAHEWELKQKLAKSVLDIEHKEYSRGWEDGMTFYRGFHVLHHQKCDRCPH